MNHPQAGTRHEALFVEADLGLLQRVLTEWLDAGFALPGHPDRERASILLVMLLDRRNARLTHGGDDARSRPAVADGPVADDAEPVAAQAVVACPDTHRLDLDAVAHEASLAP